MGRGKGYSGKDAELLQRLKHENKMLKRQISRLRKQLERVDLEQYQNLREIEEKNKKEEREFTLKTLEEQWKCYTCGDGVMRLKLWNRRDGLKYQRICDSCGNRTKVKPYKDGVKGVE